MGCQKAIHRVHGGPDSIGRCAEAKTLSIPCGGQGGVWRGTVSKSELPGATHARSESTSPTVEKALMLKSPPMKSTSY